jgi:hypothetical protein
MEVLEEKFYYIRLSNAETIMLKGILEEATAFMTEDKIKEKKLIEGIVTKLPQP